jgi:hypothetical protein
MIDQCNLCKDNYGFCIIKKNNNNPQICPCRVCNVKAICDKTCDDHYALRYVYNARGPQPFYNKEGFE